MEAEFSGMEDLLVPNSVIYSQLHVVYRASLFGGYILFLYSLFIALCVSLCVRYHIYISKHAYVYQRTTVRLREQT